MEKKKFWRKILFITVAFFAANALILTGCSSSEQTSKESDSSEGESKIHVVATENFYGEVAEAVGGDHVEVNSIITNPSEDPHDFEPTPETAKTVSKADVIIYNGLGYDDWMGRLIESSSDSDKKTVIRVGEDVLGKENGDNEHVWYNPETMPKLADALADQLAEVEPEHAEDFELQTASYQDSLQPLLDLVSQIKEPSKKTAAVTEPVFDYMLDALNYKTNNTKFPLAVEEGTDPAPKDVAKMQDDIKDHNVSFLVQNIQVNNPTITKLAKLAKENDVPIVKVTETMPEGKDYKTWMMDQLKQIEQMHDDN